MRVWLLFASLVLCALLCLVAFTRDDARLQLCLQSLNLLQRAGLCNGLLQQQWGRWGGGNGHDDDFGTEEQEERKKKRGGG